MHSRAALTLIRFVIYFRKCLHLSFNRPAFRQTGGNFSKQTAAFHTAHHAGSEGKELHIHATDS